MAQLQKSYAYVPLDIVRGATRTAEFLAKNPNGKIPLFELDDGTCLPESNAILYFLAQGSRYWPDSALEQAQVMQWLFFEQYSHEPNVATPRFWLSHEGFLDTPFKRELLAHKQQLGRQALALMDAHLCTRNYFVGDRYTIADIALYAYTHVADEGGFELANYPALVAWLERVRTQPNYIGIDEWHAGGFS